MKGVSKHVLNDEKPYNNLNFFILGPVARLL